MSDLTLSFNFQLFFNILYSQTCFIRSRPLGMAKWLLNTGWPFNTGLTNLRVYQQNKDGNKAKYLWYSDKSTTVQFSIMHAHNSSRDLQATGSLNLRKCSLCSQGNGTPSLTKRPFNIGEKKKLIKNSLVPRKCDRSRLIEANASVKEISFTVIKGHGFHDFDLFNLKMKRQWLPS